MHLSSRLLGATSGHRNCCYLLLRQADVPRTWPDPTPSCQPFQQIAQANENWHLVSADIGRKSFTKLVREAVKDRIVPDDEVELLYRVFGESLISQHLNEVEPLSWQSPPAIP